MKSLPIFLFAAAMAAAPTTVSAQDIAAGEKS